MMKYFISLLALIFLEASFSSCKKKGSPSLGEAELNGEIWQTSEYRNYLNEYPDGKLAILLSAGIYNKADDYFSTTSTFNFFHIPRSLGKHYLIQVDFDHYDERSMYSDKPFGFFFTLWQNGEQPCAMYMVDSADSLNNWISIDQQKNDFEQVWGTFSMTLIRDTSVIQTPCYRNPYGDTIKVRNGKFYVKRDK